jgi:hypothetical protein
LVRIACYDGDKQVTRVAEVVSYDSGLLTVEEADGRNTIYNVRSLGLLSVTEMLPSDDEALDFRRMSR